MRKVALVTYSKQPDLLEGDKLLVEPFKKYGFVADAVPWDQKDILWEKYDLVILRSTWDYHLRTKEFLKWLEFIESRKVKLWNPPNIIRWNINKKYLLELSNLGIPIIPTLIFNKETRESVTETIYSKRWEEIVIKPVVGASSYKVAKIKAQELDIHQDSDLIIQPFMKEVNLEGEYSFIFFNKQYSHTVLKKPKKNEFRSQRELGGFELEVKSNSQLISQAQQVMDKIHSPLLYARIDGLNIDGQLQLMELELIEPYLFFEKDNLAAEKIVDAAVYLYSASQGISFSRHQLLKASP